MIGQGKHMNNILESYVKWEIITNYQVVLILYQDIQIFLCYQHMPNHKRLQ